MRPDPALADVADLLTLPITEQFPGLRTGTVRLDSPAGTLPHRAVSSAMSHYLLGETFGDTRGGHPLGAWNSSIVEWAADRVRELIGAAGGDVGFGQNMTSLTAAFTRRVAATLHPGDEIVCTDLDHPANVDPWRAIARERGAVVRTVAVSATGELRLPTLAAVLTRRTRWVAVTGGSHALGTAPDIATFCAAARSVGARTFVDGVQMIAHRTADVDGWGCDALVSSADKWYGPHCGVLWTRDDPAGGRQELGTANVEAVLGTGVAAEVLLGWDRAAVFSHELRLTRLLVDGLAGLRRVQVLGPPVAAPRLPIVAFQVAGRPPGEVAQALARSGIIVRHGSFSAENALRRVSPGTPVAVRAGMARYTTRAEVRALVDAVAAIASSPS